VRDGRFFWLLFLVVIVGVFVGGGLGGPWPEFLSGGWFVAVFLTRRIWIPRWVRLVAGSRWGAWVDPVGHFVGPERHAALLDGFAIIGLFLGALMLAFGIREALGGTGFD
jgi:hypothetical protein